MRPNSQRHVEDSARVHLRLGEPIGEVLRRFKRQNELHMKRYRAKEYYTPPSRRRRRRKPSNDGRCAG